MLEWQDITKTACRLLDTQSKRDLSTTKEMKTAVKLKSFCDAFNISTTFSFIKTLWLMLPTQSFSAPFDRCRRVCRLEGAVTRPLTVKARILKLCTVLKHAPGLFVALCARFCRLITVLGGGNFTGQDQLLLNTIVICSSYLGVDV